MPFEDLQSAMCTWGGGRGGGSLISSSVLQLWMLQAMCHDMQLCMLPVEMPMLLCMCLVAMPLPQITACIAVYLQTTMLQVKKGQVRWPCSLSPTTHALTHARHPSTAAVWFPGPADSAQPLSGQNRFRQLRAPLPGHPHSEVHSPACQSQWR